MLPLLFSVGSCVCYGFTSLYYNTVSLHFTRQLRHKPAVSLKLFAITYNLSDVVVLLMWCMPFRGLGSTLIWSRLGGVGFHCEERKGVVRFDVFYDSGIPSITSTSTSVIYGVMHRGGTFNLRRDWTACDRWSDIVPFPQWWGRPPLCVSLADAEGGPQPTLLSFHWFGCLNPWGL